MNWRNQVAATVLCACLISIVAFSTPVVVRNVTQGWVPYATLQGAVNNANPWDLLILMRPPVVFENVRVWKPVAIVGNPWTPFPETVVGFAPSRDTFWVIANGVRIAQLRIVSVSRDGVRLRADNCWIGRNVIRNNSEDGIYLRYADGNVIRLNRIARNGDNGIELLHSDDNRILFNSIFNNTVGILQRDHSRRNEAHWNSITGNTVGVRNCSAAVFDATLNWWGDVSGPSGRGPGTGDSVSRKVIYSPWLGIGTDDKQGRVGFQLVSPMLIIVDDVGPPPTTDNLNTGYLNQAIWGSNSAALPGTDTILVWPGIYDASETISEGVEIVSGAGIDSACTTHLTGNMTLDASGILLGKIGDGFSIHGNIDVGGGIDASTIHINWNNLFGVVTNNGVGTLDATYNYWGAGSGRVGDIDYRPFLPVNVCLLLSYMEEHRMDPSEAIEFANLILDGFSANEALMIMALGGTCGFSKTEAAELISEYGWITIQNAFLMANGDCEKFAVRLLGFGFAGTGVGIPGEAGGGGAYTGETEYIYTQGETAILSFTLTSPITGDLVCDPTANLAIARMDTEPHEIVYLGLIPYDEGTSSYRMDIDTSEFEPGIYDLFIGTSTDGQNRRLHMEITGP